MNKDEKAIAEEKYEMLTDMTEMLADDAGCDYEKARDIAREVFYNRFAVDERVYIKELYEQEREAVRQEAIEYQNKVYDEDEDFGYDCAAEDYFRKAGRRYELMEEFVENAVISEEARV